MIGAIILAHDRLDRVSLLARHLANHDVKVAIHLDRRVSRTGLDAGPNVDVIQTQASDWGRFGLVQASLDAAKVVLGNDAVSHVCLLSGACLPVRPMSELKTHLAAHAGHDFIESVNIARDAWVQDGLSEERFTLWHPFSHRHMPRIFSACVEIQRRLKVRRKVPGDLSPHLGAQWWCLSAPTLRSILTDPRLPAWTRYFRSTWIPDESFFQTLVRTVAEHEPMPPLTFARFDPRGRPYVFHDEHRAFLTTQRAYFARKIDPDADALYEDLLAHDTCVGAGQTPPDPIAKARATEVSEGKGLLSSGRYPGGTNQSSVDTARPYAVMVSDDAELLEDLRQRLAGTVGCQLHGQLFAPGMVPMAQDTGIARGNLTDAAAIRDYRPAQFLQRLVWVEQSAGTAFFYRPLGPAPEAIQIAGDGNARLILIGDGPKLLTDLRRPMPPKRRFRVKRRLPKPRALWAWSRVVDAPTLRAESRADGPATEALRTILAGDWTDPAGWAVPDGSKLVRRGGA